ncbi:aminotransferase class I/II-fold pyridoxal phosphate-dependent enzyme [Planococcus sp. ISL-110]|uniref:aminotransferase class I/II-fold pyridoxal phosphate-dependent enzyme n=1 Tax=Planococcus sp. ISL-110 TaxID=2819167 RepID=UPI001BECB660|nr:aminotransferase class I/II-fold pyridoxal phosphate-dependent enzyme [Planococcus sp. ISL-110]MBT2571541.1 aminotransferase class I/II-fold pyridoxal phosphate-dependent enzyme [Planococcus sp. ISL-110]
MTQRRPIVDALIQHQNRQPISFHVPGHKHGILSGLPKEIQSALHYDLTELTGLDDLHYPEEAIKDAQLLLAEAYGAKESFLLVNGSTVGNLAMIHAACKEGDVVIVQRNSHKSIFHALELARVRPVYVSPQWDDRSMTAAGVSFKAVEAAIEAYPEAKAVVLTYPNYYGMVSHELQAIIALCHEKDMAVLVDEAHGAHFQAGSPFPVSSLALGADVVVQSAHKTLPAMTMGSFLHIGSVRVDVKKIRKYLQMFQSSSPSYLILASLDDARSYLQNYSQPDIRMFIEKRDRFLSSLRMIPHLTVVESDDPLKIMLRVDHHSGYQLKQQLEQAGIEVELADLFQVLLIMPLLKQWHVYPFAEIRSRLKEAVLGLEGEARQEAKLAVQQQLDVTVPELSFEEIDLADQEWISYTQIIGRIAAGMVTPYPPGIPLMVAGEKWTLNKVEELMNYLASEAQIQGDHRLESKQLPVLQQGTPENK